MDILYNNTFDNVDLSTSTQLASVTANRDLLLLTKIEVTGASGAGGDYSIQMWLDDKLVVPDRAVPIAAGITAFVVESKQMLLVEGQVVSFYLQGLGGDTDVSVGFVVADVTPVGSAEIVETVADPLIAAVEAALAELDITVRPTRTVVGTCGRATVTVPANLRQRAVVSMPQNLRQ